MTAFKILHISDLHLCTEARRSNFQRLYSTVPADYVDVVRSGSQHGLKSLFQPASYEPAPLEALAEFVYDRGKTYSAVLISGDLATSGLATDLRIAFDYVSGVPTYKWTRNGEPVLDIHRRPIVVVPGNHDNYTSNSPIPNSNNFALQFRRYLKDYNKRVGHSVIIDGDAALCIVYADFSFENKTESRNPFHLYGGGRVSVATLEELKRRTLALRAADPLKEKRKHIVWMIHFAPFECGSFLELTDYQSVVEAARGINVSKILCGHTHNSSMHSEAGIKILCSGSATSVGCENVIHEVYIDKESGYMTVFDYKWSKADGQFTERSYRN